jgi:1,2-phenylacetyl-CoA epoxidase catalytic subunit
MARMLALVRESGAASGLLKSSTLSLAGYSERHTEMIPKLPYVHLTSIRPMQWLIKSPSLKRDIDLSVKTLNVI